MRPRPFQRNRHATSMSDFADRFGGLRQRCVEQLVTGAEGRVAHDDVAARAGECRATGDGSTKPRRLAAATTAGWRRHGTAQPETSRARIGRATAWTSTAARPVAGVEQAEEAHQMVAPAEIGRPPRP